MGNDIFTPLAAALGTFAFFGGIGLIMWIDQKGKSRERELAHIERLKALELGQPLPDAAVARAQADASRARAAGATMILVPLGMAGMAVGVTPLVFIFGGPNLHLALLCVIWGVCGLVGLVGVSVGFETSKRREKAATTEPHAPALVEKQQSLEAIRAADMPAHHG
jgi:hypothetical protein